MLPRNISLEDPVKQGLKHDEVEVINDDYTISLEDPVKQGLKHNNPAIFVFDLNN